MPRLSTLNKEDITLKYFKESEFLCKCDNSDCPGKEFLVLSDTVTKLDKARDIFGEPIILNSAERCWAHNKAVGGSPTSSHLVEDSEAGMTQKCRALDIRHETDQEIYDALSWKNGDLNGSEMFWYMLQVIGDPSNFNNETVRILRSLIMAGFTRFGIAKNFIHVDTDINKHSHVVWTY